MSRWNDGADDMVVRAAAEARAPSDAEIREIPGLLQNTCPQRVHRQWRLWLKLNGAR
jgi:hypothetical protein